MDKAAKRREQKIVAGIGVTGNIFMLVDRHFPTPYGILGIAGFFMTLSFVIHLVTRWKSIWAS